jgi:hypothetical protein
MAAELKLSEDEVWKLMPALWANIGKNTAKTRIAYMNTITKLYQKYFSGMLANWCKEKGVMYIGHIIEDMNACMHTGNSAGHFFRALDPQSMAGIDVVLQQVMPGQNGMLHTAKIYDLIADPTFFVYALAKLAASHSHINPAMKNRAMCEIYGAYGFAEGLPFMKKLSDHFLANGINRYVPHAFTPQYPSADCPPHFYCEGNNPQFELFGELMRYMQRVIHLFEGSTHKANALVYFNADCDWGGDETSLYFHVAKTLTTSNVDFDFVPIDYLEKISVADGKMKLNRESYDVLIVPGCSCISDEFEAWVEKLTAAGAKIIFTDRLPGRTSNNLSPKACLGCEAVASDSLGSWLREKGFYDIKVEGNINSFVGLYGEITGGRAVNKLADIEEEMPYWGFGGMTDRQLRPTYRVVDIKAGTHMTIEPVSFDVYAGYAYTKDDVLQTMGYQQDPNSPIQAFRFIYAGFAQQNTHNFFIGGRVGCDIGGWTSLSAEARYDKWGGSDKEMLMMKPQITADVNADFRVFEKLTFRLGYNFTRYTKGSSERYGCKNDLYARASYQIFDWLGAYIQGNNLLNCDYYEYAGYRARGARGSLGVTANF